MGCCQRCLSPCEEPEVRAQNPGPVKEEREKEGGEMKVGGRVDTGGELGGVKKTGVRAGRVRMKELEQVDGRGVDEGGGELSRRRWVDGSDG